MDGRREGEVEGGRKGGREEGVKEIGREDWVGAKVGVKGRSEGVKKERRKGEKLRTSSFFFSDLSPRWGRCG